jgi:hypothetical protein
MTQQYKKSEIYIANSVSLPVSYDGPFKAFFRNNACYVLITMVQGVS